MNQVVAVMKTCLLILSPVMITIYLMKEQLTEDEMDVLGNRQVVLGDEEEFEEEENVGEVEELEEEQYVGAVEELVGGIEEIVGEEELEGTIVSQDQVVPVLIKVMEDQVMEDQVVPQVKK